MPAKLTTKAPMMSFYKANGKTLKEVWKSILKSGPVDPNDKKHVAFLTTTELSFDPDKTVAEGEGRITVERKTGWFEAKAKVKKLDMQLLCYVKGPRISMNKLTKPAQREWRRFYDKAVMHELEHVKKAEVECAAIAAEINALRGVGLGETEAEAAQFARDDLITQIYDGFIGQMDDRLNKIHKKFDKSTKHGEKSGAKLHLDVN